jgi:hypothetical protein
MKTFFALMMILAASQLDAQVQMMQVESVDAAAPFPSVLTSITNVQQWIIFLCGAALVGWVLFTYGVAVECKKVKQQV